MSHDTKIAIVGAGPMGLAVAYQLVTLGYRPVLFEAGDRIGGMATCFPFAGEDIERFYHFHCTSDHAFIELLNELELTDRFHWVKTKMGYYYGGHIQAWGNPIALLKFRGIGLGAKIRYGLHAFVSSKRSDFDNLDGKEATSWLKFWVGHEAYEKLWRNLFEHKFYHEQHNLSAAWIWARIKRIANSRYNLFSEKLGYLEGGTQTYLDRIEEFLNHGGAQIKLGLPVERINVHENKAVGLTTSEGYEEFDKICCTIPLPFISDMVPDLSAFELYQYGLQKSVGVVCVIVACNKKISDNFWLNINDEQMDIPGLVEYSNLRPCNTAIAYVPFYMPSQHPNFQQPDEYYRNKVKNYIQTINPNILDKDIQDVQVSRYKYAQPVCGINFLANLPDRKTTIQNLWIADTSYYYPEDRGISESTKYGRMLAEEISQCND